MLADLYVQAASRSIFDTSSSDEDDAAPSATTSEMPKTASAASEAFAKNLNQALLKRPTPSVSKSFEM